MRPYVPAIAACLLAVPLYAQSVSVSDHHTLHVPGGEAQSTVVPPNVNDQCKAGRFLVSDDHKHPPDAGVVTGRDLDKPDGPDIPATFDPPPHQLSADDPALVPQYAFGSADHDMLTLPNGNVLYLAGAFTRAPLNKPWAKDTFRDAFGPNARTNLMVWRSTDCGRTFQFRGEMDPADYEDGSCANPQFLTNADGSLKTSPPWNMGGSDGQLVNFDPETNRLYLTFRCVGYNPVRGAEQFTLDPKKPLNKTLVTESSDEGRKWTSDGFMHTYNEWRMPVIPFNNNKTLAFGYYDGVIFGRRNAEGKFVYDAKYTPAQEGSFGYDNDWPMFGPWDNPWFFAIKLAYTVAGRTPDSENGMFVAFPDTIPNAGQGLRIFFFDAATGKGGEPETPLVPERPGMNNFLMHPVVIDSGAAPPLLYWSDVDWATKSVTIRGRFILGQGQLSDPIVISKQDGKERSFNFVQACSPHWFGDYQTAGGGFKKPQKITSKGATFSYFPMWIEPDDTIHFARVDFSPSTSELSKGVTIHKMDPRRFTVRRAVSPETVRVPRVLLEQERMR